MTVTAPNIELPLNVDSAQDRLRVWHHHGLGTNLVGAPVPRAAQRVIPIRRIPGNHFTLDVLHRAQLLLLVEILKVPRVIIRRRLVIIMAASPAAGRVDSSHEQWPSDGDAGECDTEGRLQHTPDQGRWYGIGDVGVGDFYERDDADDTDDADAVSTER